MSTQVASARPSTASGLVPSWSATRRSTSSTRALTWRSLRPEVTTKASTTPSSSPMASTTVSAPSLSSAAWAATNALSGTVGRPRELTGLPTGTAPSLGPPASSMHHVQHADGRPQGRGQDPEADRGVPPAEPASGVEVAATGRHGPGCDGLGREGGPSHHRRPRVHLGPGGPPTGAGAAHSGCGHLGTAYRLWARMYRSTGSGTRSERGWPARTASRTCELETATSAPSTR